MRQLVLTHCSKVTTCKTNYALTYHKCIVSHHNHKKMYSQYQKYSLSRVLPPPSSSWSWFYLTTTTTDLTVKGQNYFVSHNFEHIYALSNQVWDLHIAHLCPAMCKTDDRTIWPFVGLETMREIAVLVSHRFNCFG